MKLLKLIPAVILVGGSLLIIGPQDVLADSKSSSSSDYNLKCLNNSGLNSPKAANYSKQTKTWKHTNTVSDSIGKHSHQCSTDPDQFSTGYSTSGTYKKYKCNQCNYTDES